MTKSEIYSRLEFNDIGSIPISSLKTDFIRIENLSQFLFKVPAYHPKDPRYLKFWRKAKKIIVEGMWGREFGMHRYAPPALIFYANLALIEDTDENKQTTFIKPSISDLEWELFYGLLEAEGFSGFAYDEEYSSDELLKRYLDSKTPIADIKQARLFNSKGELLKYMPPRENIRRLHEYDKGCPLYYNEAKNFIILGSRGGGKSYLVGLGKLLHSITVDGGKYYNEKDGKFYKTHHYNPVDILINKDHPVAVDVLGSGDTDKSSELFAKIIASMNAMATESDFGVWGEPGDFDYTPCPLFKDMSGSATPGNKKNAWQHKYKLLLKGREVHKGTRSRLYHVSYSDKKQGGAQAGAGGRYLYSVVEEAGLVKNAIGVYNSNNSAVARNGRQFGVQIFLGTSGNLDMIKDTKKLFMNPQDYNMVAYRDEWENMGKHGHIGFFLPYYMTLRQFKDANGNTDFVKVFTYIKERRAKFSGSDDPSVIREEKMNRPIVPSEMWISKKGYYLPYEEAIARERTLLVANKYKRIGIAINLHWDSKSLNGVRHTINHQADPFYEFPINSNKMSIDGALMIYDFPKGDNIPRDMYIFTHDPYVSENIDEGGSLGATHVWISPKYWDEYMPTTGPMVATYIGKPIGGLKHYYENQNKLMHFYGAPHQGMAYEANRGSDCKNYYLKQGLASLLFPRPVISTDQNMYSKKIANYGIVVSGTGKLAKIQMLDRLDDFLLQKINVDGEVTRVIETIPCIFTVRQIIGYDLEHDNFDAVSSMLLFPAVIRELEFKLLDERNKRRAGNNDLGFLSMNPNIFHEQDTMARVKKFNQKYLNKDDKTGHSNSLREEALRFGKR